MVKGESECGSAVEVVKTKQSGSRVDEGMSESQSWLKSPVRSSWWQTRQRLWKVYSLNTLEG